MTCVLCLLPISTGEGQWKRPRQCRSPVGIVEVFLKRLSSRCGRRRLRSRSGEVLVIPLRTADWALFVNTHVRWRCARLAGVQRGAFTYSPGRRRDVYNCDSLLHRLSLARRGIVVFYARFRGYMKKEGGKLKQSGKARGEKWNGWKSYPAVLLNIFALSQHYCALRGTAGKAQPSFKLIVFFFLYGR